MNKPDPLTRALTEISEGAEGILRSITPDSLNLIVEIVEKRVQDRIQHRRTIMIRWMIGVGATLIGGLATVAYNFRAELNTDLDSLELSVQTGVKNAIPDTYATPSLLPSQPFESVENRTYDLDAESSERLRFNINEDALYIIDAVGDEDFDSYIDLYWIDQNEHIASDDDGGGNLNSRLELELENGIYEVLVSELFGRAGRVTVSVTRVN